MSDTYQAVYDAARSRMSNGDIGEAVASAVRDANLGHYVERAMSGICEAACSVADEQTRASVLFRPTLSQDGNQWCARYGSDMQSGVVGFGDTPSLAMRDFDRAWAVGGFVDLASDATGVHKHSADEKGDSCQPK